MERESSTASGSRSLRDILLAHSARYPRWQPADLYKLCHQGALGSEHAVVDESSARSWLARELAELGPGPEEPLIDPISPDGDIVRVHLRPFAWLEHDPEALLEAFLRTAREYRGSVQRVLDGLAVAMRLAGEGLLSLDPTEVELLAARMKACGFPAVHHTAAFLSYYRPAYRVVAREFLPESLVARAD